MLGGGGFVNGFGQGVGARGARACPRPDGLKMNSAQMKTTELQMLWKLVKVGEDSRLSVADLALLLRIRFALQKYEAHPGRRLAHFTDCKIEVG
jgi:hypothetical protein